MLLSKVHFFSTSFHVSCLSFGPTVATRHGDNNSLPALKEEKRTHQLYKFDDYNINRALFVFPSLVDAVKIQHNLCFCRLRMLETQVIDKVFKSGTINLYFPLILSSRTTIKLLLIRSTFLLFYPLQIFSFAKAHRKPRALRKIYGPPKHFTTRLCFEQSI